jgi:hypothetical protein
MIPFATFFVGDINFATFFVGDIRLVVGDICFATYFANDLSFVTFLKVDIVKVIIFVGDILISRKKLIDCIFKILIFKGWG